MYYQVRILEKFKSHCISIKFAVVLLREMITVYKRIEKMLASLMGSTCSYNDMLILV